MIRTVDLRVVTGELLAPPAEAGSLNVRTDLGPVTVALDEVLTLDVSRGRLSRLRSAGRASLRFAVLLGIVGAVVGGTAPESFDLQSIPAGIGTGAAVGGIEGAILGATVGLFVPMEAWEAVAPANYRAGLTLRAARIPYRSLSLRFGGNGQTRRDTTDPADVVTESGFLGGWSGAIAIAAARRVDERNAVEFEAWLPRYIVVPPKDVGGAVDRRFRDRAFTLAVRSEFTDTSVRPFWLIGLSYRRVQEDGLSERKSAAGLLLGLGVDVPVSRHLAVSSDVRMDLTGFADAVDYRWSLRPGVALVVRY